MITQQAVIDSYLVPFKLVEDLDLACGYEKSFKLIDGQLLRNRYLIGIERQQLDDDKLSIILEQMHMPNRFVESLHAHISTANLVLLGFEQDASKCTYKVYLEYWDEIREQLAHQPAPVDPVTMFLGFKWNAFDVSQAVMTDYLYYPGLSLEQIMARIDNLWAAQDDRRTVEVAAAIIRLAVEQVSPERFVYLEASESGNPRKSFDINLYAARLGLESVYPLVTQLGRFFAVAKDEIDRLFEDSNDAMLGHLSGGIDRNGGSFFSVYYESGACTPS